MCTLPSANAQLDEWIVGASTDDALAMPVIWMDLMTPQATVSPNLSVDLSTGMCASPVAVSGAARADADKQGGLRQTLYAGLDGHEFVKLVAPFVPFTPRRLPESGILAPAMDAVTRQ